MEEDENRPSRSNIPTFFSLKDVITILFPIVAVAGAFFTYGTRISVLEERFNMDHVQLEKMNELGHQLDTVANLQRQRLEWAHDELDKLRKEIEELEELVEEKHGE